MGGISLPSKFDVKPGTHEFEATVSIQPCYPGYGTTLGNALRRVLLSSLNGAAITAFKVKGADHEFSSLPNVKEDLVEISLNLKQVKVKSHSSEPVRVTLSVKGDKVVTAKDIQGTADVEIVSPEAPIATLTDKNAELEMELIVEQGLGYEPTEARERELEVGMIPIDAIYTPVKKVGFNIAKVRVGKMTNYEGVELTIETDGSLTPAEAVTRATDILLEQFNTVRQLSTGEQPVAQKVDEKTEEVTDEVAS